MSTNVISFQDVLRSHFDRGMYTDYVKELHKYQHVQTENINAVVTINMLSKLRDIISSSTKRMVISQTYSTAMAIIEMIDFAIHNKQEEIIIGPLTGDDLRRIISSITAEIDSCNQNTRKKKYEEQYILTQNINKNDVLLSVGKTISKISRALMARLDPILLANLRIHIDKEDTNTVTDTKRIQPSLQLLYPKLSNDLNELKISRTESVTHGYSKYMSIVNNLMLLGFSLREAIVYVAAHTDSGILDLVKCEYTNVVLPRCYTLEAGGKYYTTEYDYSIQENDNRYYGFPADNSLEAHGRNVWRDHKANPLAFLYVVQPKKIQTNILTDKSVFSPIPYMGIELEVELKESQSFGIGVPVETTAPDFVITPDTHNRIAGTLVGTVDGVTTTTINTRADTPLSKIGCPENIAYQVRSSLGKDYVMLKHDGSLRGTLPFEIVTVPSTLDVHVERWSKFLDDNNIKKHLKSYSSGNCGMHVHISRNSFTGLHLAKFLKFINSTKNHKFVQLVAQRGNNHFSKYQNTSLTECADFMSTRNHVYTDRYYAVNCNNKGTVEVRIFRGNLSKVAFLKNLEFVHALWMYSRDCSTNELVYTDFLRWLYDESNQVTCVYKHLKLWLVGKGIHVSNNIIRKTDDPATKAKKLTNRAKIKKIQSSMKRKYEKVLTNQEVVEQLVLTQ